MDSKKALWNGLEGEFGELAKEGEVNANWSFDASHGYQNTWSLSGAHHARLHRNLWARLAEAGANLPKKGAPYSMFPTRLLAEPCTASRWCAAVRHAGINVVRFEHRDLRAERGMLYKIAAASALLCKKLAARPEPADPQ